MTAKLLEKIYSLCTAVAGRGKAVGEQQEHAGQEGARAGRVKLREVCTYVLCEPLDDESFVIREGEGLVLDISSLGMLILMNEEPQIKQILEVRVAGPTVGPTVSLLEVCWTRKILSEAGESRYVIEGKVLFGPYSLLQRKTIRHSELT